MEECKVTYEIGNVVEADMCDGMRLIRVTERREPIKNGRSGLVGVLVSTSVPDDSEVGDDVWAYDDQIIAVRKTNYAPRPDIFHMKENMAGDWERVGVIGVDTGMCWLGDPCYIIHQEEPNTDLGSTWEEFVSSTIAADAHQFKYNLGRKGLGVTVRTGAGDGVYPVEIRRNAHGNIAEVRVVFQRP